MSWTGLLLLREIEWRGWWRARRRAGLRIGQPALRASGRCERAGADVEVTADLDAALNADGLVVPGRRRLRRVHGRAARGRAAQRIIGRRLAGGRPVLGICVGMQILFERGVEHGVETEGCGEWPGTVERLQAPTSCRTWAGTPSTRRPRARALFAGLDRGHPLLLRALLRRARWELASPTAARAAAGDLGRARRRPVRRRGGERAAVRPPSSTRRSPATPARPAAQLARDAVAAHPGRAVQAGPARPSSCCPPSTSPAARPSGSSGRGRLARRATATRWRPRWPGSAEAPSGSTSSTSTPRSAAAPTPSCWPTVVGRLDIAVELSGGIRDDDSLAAALATGCRRVNIGTAALEHPEWCAAAIAEHGDRVAVGLDVRGTTLAARGWTRDGGDLYEVLARLDAEGCARYVVTDVNKDGMLQGPNLELLRDVCAATDRPGGRLRRGHRAGRPGRAGRAGAGRRRGRDHRQGALRGARSPCPTRRSRS